MLTCSSTGVALLAEHISVFQVVQQRRLNSLIRRHAIRIIVGDLTSRPLIDLRACLLSRRYLSLVFLVLFTPVDLRNDVAPTELSLLVIRDVHALIVIAKP